MSKILCVGLFSVILVALVNATCLNPEVSITSYSTQDATILTKLAHVGEFTLNCDNSNKLTLFAEFPCGRIIPVARISDSKYQISWTEEIKKSSSDNIVLRLFDEEGFSNVRKAQRDGEQVASVKSLADITIETQRAYKGPWVNSEIIAALVVGSVAYFALTTKNKVQS